MEALELTTPANITYQMVFKPFFFYSKSPLEGCSAITYTDNNITPALKGIYSALSIISMVSSIFIAITIFYNPKLRIHPSKLIGYMAVCEALSCFNALIWAINPIDFICYFGLHYMFNWTTFGSQSKVESLLYLCNSNQIVFSYFQTVSLAFNFCLCHDLVQTLRNPFSPGKRRMKFYFVGSILVAGLLTSVARKNLQDRCFLEQQPIEKPDSDYASQRLTRPGMSAEVRFVFIRKHIAYVATFIIIWTFYLAYSYFKLYNAGIQIDAEKETLMNVLQNISIITAMCTGTIMSLIRIQEPYFKFLIKKQFKAFFGILMEEKDIQNSQQYINDSLATFLTSSLNVELVHVILESITKHTVGKLYTGADYLSYLNEAKNFTEKNRFNMDTIQIRNPEKWKVAKLPEFIIDHNNAPHHSTIKLSKLKEGDLSRGATVVNNQQITSQSNQSPQHNDEDEDVLIINEDVQVTEFAPDVFAFLRDLDGFDHSKIKASLSPEFNRDSVFRAGESQGKSGSFFFFSHDKNFIIKTMTQSDLDTFKNLFVKYFEHVSAHPNSLLARIYGIYTVQMEDVEPVNLILMGNTKKSNDKMIEHVFDLKGSFVNREEKGKNLKNTATLKDLNLLALKKEKFLLRFKKDDRQEIIDMMERDSEILKAHNIMDYSLLFAIERNSHYKGIKGPSRATTSTNSDQDDETDKTLLRNFDKTRHTFLSHSGRYIYHLAIIDYLQDFNIEKKLENRLKMIINKQGAEISAIEPKGYQTRYLKFMKQVVIVDQKDEQQQKKQ
ncbi:phosphatidylinositol phosphate kinase [Stylonychia lemnae]|uniref:Phosphatidylinositol phosphate kinase n=1 Tax=Stylonychia lemnae TaxID=5949 RepID=A0A078ARL7_STYLE|nr:phosphatidylinositol phosphate kinase [Stylonychia lemnae]|eukprot:CDW83493.1 phosphatidylinositol phosphate kinase [Stylonychia lemnae]